MRTLSLLGPSQHVTLSTSSCHLSQGSPLHICPPPPLASIPLLLFCSENQTMAPAVSRRRRALPYILPTSGEEVGACRAPPSPTSPSPSTLFTSHPWGARVSTLEPVRVAAACGAIFPGPATGGDPGRQINTLHIYQASEHKQHYKQPSADTCV